MERVDPSAPDDQDTPTRTFKIILLGDSGVGKSSIISRFISDRFSLCPDATIGVSFCIKPVTVGEEAINLQVWDTAGQEIYRAVTRSYYRNSDCAVLVCDLTKQWSFESLSYWVKDIQMLAPEKCKIVIVGNKVDLNPREVSLDALQALGDSTGSPVFETSAKSGSNIRELFEECALLIYAAPHEVQEVKARLENPPGVALEKGTRRKKKRRCCR
jgi:small GTP-binding protein